VPNAVQLVIDNADTAVPRTLPCMEMEESGYAVDTTSLPAEDVGGDFFVVVPRARGLCVVIGDVCGKGRDAAAIAARIRPRLYTLAHTFDDPARLLGALNRALAEFLPADRFITAAALELDSEHGSMTIANAGHVPAAIRRATGGTTIVGRASGQPLGILRDVIYSSERDRLDAGDIVVLMTDGVLETIESDLAAMRTVAGLLSEAPDGAAAVKRCILAEVERLRAGRADDDLTLLCIERLDSRVSATFSCRASS
jgi:serine phosphatase RsbU (regulator of sigma subunit)